MRKIAIRISEIAGSVIAVDASGVAFGELAVVASRHGESLAQVIRLNGERVFLQVFAGTGGISTGDQVRFLGHQLQISASDNLLGRVFDERAGRATPGRG